MKNDLVITNIDLNEKSITVSSGSLSPPVLSFNPDTDTGFYWKREYFGMDYILNEKENHDEKWTGKFEEEINK